MNASGAATTTKSRKAPNLSSTDDIADYLLRRVGTPGSEGYESMSETEASEGESDTNAVELPEDYVGRGNKKGERKAVRLVETGPRLELKLVKVVEGLVGSKKGEGETVFHEFGKCLIRIISLDKVDVAFSAKIQNGSCHLVEISRGASASQRSPKSRTSRQRCQEGEEQRQGQG